MSNNPYTASWRGTTQLQLTGGSTAGDAIGTQYTIPTARVDTMWSENKASPGVINATSYESEEYVGMITGMVRLSFLAKTNSFLTANLLNELLWNLDSVYKTNQFAIKQDDKFLAQVHDGAYCMGVTLTQAFDPVSAQPGPVSVSVDFKVLYPFNMKPGGATTFSGGSTDAGQITNCTQVDFGSSPTADMVWAYTVTAGRVQRYVPGFNQTRFFNAMASGGFGGSVALVQSPSYDETFGTSGTIRIGQTGAGFAINFLTSHMESTQPYTTDIGTIVQTWACRDLIAGGNPMTITSL